MRSYYSTVVAAPADRVWESVRDFNGLATWFSPDVSSSEIEDGMSGDTVGAVRRFVLGGATVRERLVGFSDVDRRHDYTFEGTPPFPVTNYLATLKVTPVIDGDHAFVEWWTDFDCEVAEQATWEAYFREQVFAPALDALKRHLGV